MKSLIEAHQRFPRFANDLVLLDPRGAWFEAAEARKRVAELSLTYSEATTSHVRAYRDLGLVHGLVAESGGGRLRYTAIYRRHGFDWMPVQLQYTALVPEATASLRSAPAPVHAPWVGLEPTGPDDEVLLDLNEAYVQAFRDADVAWYDAHLADDYLVINGNGTMDDRGQALTEFAKPIFRDYLARFPLDKVRVRRWGDAAVIDAENAYERKDGRSGVNRYTDVWYRQASGRWLCLAAHITPVQTEE